jgi:anti-anti-sigma factor
VRDDFDERFLDRWGATTPPERVMGRQGLRREGIPPLIVETRDAGEGPVTIAFRGELDMSTAPVADQALQTLDPGQRPILVDLGQLRFIDSTGLRAILEADGRIRQAGGALVLIRGPRPVHRVFELTRADQRLTIVDSSAQVGRRGSD